MKKTTKRLEKEDNYIDTVKRKSKSMRELQRYHAAKYNVQNTNYINKQNAEEREYGNIIAAIPVVL